MSDIDGSRKWSFQRIASAALLLIVILGALGFGIFTWVGGNNSNSNNNKSQTSSTSNPKGGKSGGASGGIVGDGVGSNGASAAANAGSGSSSTGSSSSSSSSSVAGGQLTNTGPGDTAIIGFVSAAVMGTAVHYGMRRVKSHRV